MKRLLLLASAVLAVGALAGTASADPPILHEAKAPYSGTMAFPAGSLCDFNLQVDYAGTDTFTILSNGYEQVLEQFQATSTNLDTGVSVNERESYDFTFNYLTGAFKEAGVDFKLRDATGKLVIVDAGLAVVDASGNVVKLTPDIGSGSLGDELCPVLGGNAA